MQLKRLYIERYKILKNFDIEFPCDFKQYISVFIGINGSGKSTILEAIAQIFSSVFLNEKAKFGFKLEYIIRHDQVLEETSTTIDSMLKNLWVKLSADNEGSTIQITTQNDSTGKNYTTDILEKSKMAFVVGTTPFSYLPDTIVIYYSGLSKIMEGVVKPHNEIISNAYRKNNTLKDRDFFYFTPAHFPIILTSLLCYEYGDIPKFLSKKANIEGMQSISIHLQKPEWASAGIQEFWGAKGQVLNTLKYLDENSATPNDLENPESSNRIGNIVIEAFQDQAIIITIITQQRLFELREQLRDERGVFEFLNTLYDDGMLNKIEFAFRKNNGPNFKILSEGEQQAIITKGLTELLSEKNSLFLFDEPDTYLHPKWQRQFITDIEKTVENNLNAENSFVIATHSPQLLSNAKTELNFVKIIEDGKLVEKTPKHYGRDIATILYDLMDVKGRNKEIRDKLSSLYILIDDEEIEEAEKSLFNLQELLGADDPELVRAKIQLDYIKEDL